MQKRIPIAGSFSFYADWAQNLQRQENRL